MAVVTPVMRDIFEEAFERAGLQMRSGYDLSTARRSLNFLLLEWQNRGLNMFAVEAGTMSIVAGTATYTLPSDTVDIMEHQLRTGTGESQSDTNLKRVSVSDYAKTTNKNTTGRPTQIFVQRTATEVTVTLWPVPDSSYTLAYYRMAGIDGLESGIGTTASVPPRFIPALVSGLAFHIATKKPEAAARAPLLKGEYEEQYNLATLEDRDKFTTSLTPMRQY